MTKAQIESRVEGWNWNMNIFEIYDELRDGHTAEEQEQLLTFAYNYFNNDAMIEEGTFVIVIFKLQSYS